MQHPTTGLLIGWLLLILNAVTFLAGLYIIIVCLPKIGPGDMQLELKIIGKVKEANAHLAGLFMGIAMMIVSITYSTKAYTECASSDSMTLAEFVRHHCPEMHFR